MRWFGLVFRDTVLEPPAPSGWARLVTTRSGACLVRAGGVLAAATPRDGLFVPDGVRLALQATGQVDVRMLYLHVDWIDSLAVRLRAVAVTPLLRELIERLVRSGALDADEPRERRLVDVVLDELGALASAPFALPIPADPRALRAAEHALASEACASLEELAIAACTSARTLERLFRDQTGFSVGRWQRRARLLNASRAVVAGASVTDAAYDAGFASPSAFIASCRREFGATPGRYARRALAR